MSELSKADIKEWLKVINKDRPWLAEQLGVSPNTVNNWLSTSATIPTRKLKLIEGLKETTENEKATLQQPSNQIFSVEIDLPTFRAYNQAALADGLTLEEWAIKELNEAADIGQDIEGLPKPLLPYPPHGDGLRAAEDGRDYA